MIVVLGLGRETRAWLARRDPSDTRDVVVLDEGGTGVEDAEGLTVLHVDLDDAGSVRAALAGAPIDEVVRSPGVSPYRAGTSWLVDAAPTATPTGLWLAGTTPEDLIAITGTKGKSTVASMTAHLLRAAGRNATLAGNIGVALTTVDPSAARDDLVVELSSYQLADLVLTRPATVAAVTTLFTDHVPWHGDVARYHADKLRLLDQATWRIVGEQVAELPIAAGAFDEVAASPTTGVVAALAAAGMTGPHHAQAAMLALALTERRLGHDVTELAASLAEFRPLPHRLAPVATVRGRTFVDDSISTVPESTLAALATWRPRGPVTLLLGGDDRGQDVDALVAALADPDVRAALLPPLGGRIAEAVRSSGRTTGADGVVEVADLREAVAWADRVTPRGGSVVLSPAAPSFGAFRDFVQRGEVFAGLVGELEGSA